MNADVGFVQHELLALNAIVCNDGHAACHAYQELVALLVSMFTARFRTGNVKDQEKAQYFKRNLLAYFTDAELAA